MTDIPGDPRTTATIAVGTVTAGIIDATGDHDWYEISLTAGQSITITATGGGSLDTYLNLYDSTGTTILASNDDIVPGQNVNSRMTFTTSTGGTYFIDVGAWHDQSSGTYDLLVQPGRPIWTYDQIAAQLTTYYWGGDAHHFNVTPGGTLTVNLSGLTSSEQALARAALADWTDIIGVHFQEVASGGQITFSDATDPSGPIAQTIAHWSNGIISSANIQISSDWIANYGTGLNSYSFQTYIHEIGHALGLGHAGEYNVSANYLNDAVFANDAWNTSVMSYFSAQDNFYLSNQGFSADFDLTPMIADILAAQQLYGASTTTRTGDTVYGYNSTAGNPVFNASLYPNAAYTIYDNGGIDTLDYSRASANQLINLNPETFSNVNGQTGNVMIARGVVIEGAIAGSGDDTIIQNAANNLLNGGAGNDTLSYETASAGVTVNLSLTTTQNTGGAGLDTVSGFENLIGSDFADVLTGGASTISILGGAGDDLIDAGNANPATRLNLSGGDGNDTFLLGVDTGPFVVDGGPGFNVVDGSHASGGLLLSTNQIAPGGIDWLLGIQKIIGSNFDDNLTGRFAGDVIIGGAGNDTLTGYGATQLFGGTGNDTYSISSTTDQITDNPGEGIDTVNAACNYSLGANLENLTLHEYLPWDPYAGATITPAPPENFSGTGNDLANVITGNLADNILSGLGGDDTLTGGGGNDSLTGGVGNDTFRDTAAGLSGDTITDFGVGDRIIITDANFASFGFSVSGNTLTYTGGSLTLGPVPGNIAAQAAAGGGVELVIRHHAINDFNGDGRSDILWRNDDGHLTDWLGTASGALADNLAALYRSIGSDWQVAGTGDFNGDGRADILWRSSDGHLTDWLGTSTGGFSDNVSSIYRAVGTDWQVAGIGDFNGDGRADILWRNSDGHLTDWLGTSTGGFSDNVSSIYRAVGTDWQVAGIGDFNGDGRADILWRNSDGHLTDWLGTSAGSFSDNLSTAYGFVDPQWEVAGVGDFNGDGYADILWRNADGRVTDWLGTANGSFTDNLANAYANVGTDWQVQAIGDFDGDGRDDILWRNNDGRVTEWLGTTSGSFSDNLAQALRNVDTHWQVDPATHLLG